MLLTHPLPDSRLSDARNRANQMKPHPTASSQDYLFAKMRILGMYGADENSLTPELLDKLSKGTVREQLAAKYGQAVQLYQAKKYDEARNLLQPLLAQQPSNIWFLDLMTDIDLGQNKSAAAIARLQNAMVKQNDEPVLQLNLANAYVQGATGSSHQTATSLYFCLSE